MKKKILILSFCFLNFICFAEFKPYYSAFRGEVNMNSEKNICMGLGIDQIYSITDSVKLGTNFLFDTDFTRFNSVELLISLDYVAFENLFNKKVTLLIGVAAGPELIFYDGTYKSTFNGGIQAKMLLKTKYKSGLTFIPVVRFGYPYLFSAGLEIGVKF